MFSRPSGLGLVRRCDSVAGLFLSLPSVIVPNRPNVQLVMMHSVMLFSLATGTRWDFVDGKWGWKPKRGKTLPNSWVVYFMEMFEDMDDLAPPPHSKETPYRCGKPIYWETHSENGLLKWWVNSIYRRASIIYDIQKKGLYLPVLGVYSNHQERNEHLFMYERDAPWHRGLSGLLPTLEVTSPSVQLFNSEVSQKKKANRTLST